LFSTWAEGGASDYDFLPEKRLTVDTTGVSETPYMENYYSRDRIRMPRRAPIKNCTKSTTKKTRVYLQRGGEADLTPLITGGRGSLKKKLWASGLNTRKVPQAPAQSLRRHGGKNFTYTYVTPRLVTFDPNGGLFRVGGGTKVRNGERKENCPRD